MAWTVRNEYGALDFETFEELERAWRLGLVSHEDEVRDPGSHNWRRAGTHPRLARVRAEEKKQRSNSPVPFAYILTAVLLGAVALFAVATGTWWVGLLLALILATMLMKVTTRTFKPRRT